MGKLSREEVKRIVAEDMPGYCVVDESESEGQEGVERDAPRRSHAQPEAQSPDLRALRNKYVRSKYLDADAPNTAEEPSDNVSNDAEASETDGSASNAGDVIVAVEPEESAHPWDRGARPKAAVISGKEKKIIGQQG